MTVTMQGMASTDIEVRPGLRVGIETKDTILQLTFIKDEKLSFGIELNRAEAQHIGKRLMEIASEQT